MTTETQSVVRAAYERALQEHLQKNLRTSADWDRFNTIKRERDAPLMIEQAAFKRDYMQRLSDAKQIILREENGVSLDQPLPPWVDAHSNAEALQSKADIGAWVFVANRLCDSDCKCVWHGGPAGLVGRDGPVLRPDWGGHYGVGCRAHKTGILGASSQSCQSRCGTV
ncbi:MAG: hypothetical protein ACRBBS_15755 [Thalassovita sp.]